MPVKIHAPKSAHDQAADDFGAPSDVTETSKVLTKVGADPGEPPLEETHSYNAEPVAIAVPFERIEVGTSFKMPVASYTMLEFSVRRSIPYNPEERSPDDVFAETRSWVEAKLNSMIEEQQSANG